MSMFDDPDDDEFTEMFDADFGRIDLVGKGANGLPFLVAKADPAGGLIPPALMTKILKEQPMTQQVRKDDDDPFHRLRATSQPEFPEQMAQRGPVTGPQYHLGDVFEVESPSGQLLGRHVDVAKAQEHARRVNGYVVVRTPPASDTAVRKAKDDTSSEVAVYDAKGNLVGTVEVDKIKQLAEPPTKQEKQPPAPDLQPAPAANAGVPAAMAKAQASVGAIADALHERVQKADTVGEREAAQTQLDGLAMGMLQPVQAQHMARRRP